MAYFLNGPASSGNTVSTAAGVQLTNDPYMAQVAKATGNEKALKTLLPQLKSELSKTNIAFKSCKGPASTCAALKVRIGQIEQAIKSCNAALKAASSTAPNTVAIEAATARIDALTGKVKATGPATIIETPTLAPPGAQEQLLTLPPGTGPITVQDVTVSSGTTFIVAAVGAAAILGYLALRKKGHA